MAGEYDEYYRILGVAPGCSWTELKLAYRRLVHVWHPDQRRDEAIDPTNERIKAINRAYRQLSHYYRRYGELPLTYSANEHISDEPPPAHTWTQERHAGTHQTTRRRASWRFRSLLILLGAVVALGYAFIINMANYNHAPTTKPNEAAVTNGLTASNESTSPDEESLASQNPNYIMVGSTIGEVIAAQGPPTNIVGDTWHYGQSRVYFRDGRVTHWDHDDSSPLRTRLSAKRTASSNATFFTIGSTKADVRSAQGNPLLETDDSWDYGTSRVYFKDNRVAGWDESPMHPLRIRR